MMVIGMMKLSGGDMLQTIHREQFMRTFHKELSTVKIQTSIVYGLKVMIINKLHPYIY